MYISERSEGLSSIAQGLCVYTLPAKVSRRSSRSCHVQGTLVPSRPSVSLCFPKGCCSPLPCLPACLNVFDLQFEKCWMERGKQRQEPGDRGGCHCPEGKHRGRRVPVPGAGRAKAPLRQALAPRLVCVPSNLWAQHIPVKDVQRLL